MTITQEGYHVKVSLLGLACDSFAYLMCPPCVDNGQIVKEVPLNSLNFSR